MLLVLGKIFLIFGSLNCQTNKVKEEKNRFRDVVNDFTQDAYVYMSKANLDKNFVFSPLSLHTALSMVYLGSKPGSKTEMELSTSLGGLARKQQIRQHYKDYITFLKDQEENILFGNHIWVKENYKLKENYTNTLEDSFYAGLSNLDFDDGDSVSVVNNWVSNNTNGKINELIKSFDPNTLLYIANALYFKDSWRYEFDFQDFSGQKLTEIFTTVKGEKLEVPMMEQSSTTLKYEEFMIDNKKFEIVKIPYINLGFDLKIIMPEDLSEHLYWLEKQAELSKIRDLQGPQKFNFFRNISDSHVGVDVYVKLPPFKIHTKTKAKNMFQKLQVNDLFTEVAELDDISDDKPLKVNDIVHESVIEVTPTGTEGAAATGVEIVFFSASGKGSKDVIVNKPFIFVLEDINNQIPILVGRVMNPLE